MSIHHKKIWPIFFNAVITGRKRFELRKDDGLTPYTIGDELVLQEWHPERAQYTGRSARARVTYLIRGKTGAEFWIAPGYCAMSIDLIGEC